MSVCIRERQRSKKKYLRFRFRSNIKGPQVDLPRFKPQGSRHQTGALQKGLMSKEKKEAEEKNSQM